MVARNTEELSSKIDEFKTAINALVTSAGKEFTPLITDRFLNALLGAGMPESEANEYSGSLRESFKRINAALDETRKELSIAEHVATVAPIRARKRYPAAASNASACLVLR